MKTVVGIRFRPCGKIIYYDPQDLDIRLDDGVVIDTDKGEEFGVVAQPRSQMPDVLVPYDPQPIIRVADDADWEMHEKLLLKEREGP